MNDADILKTEQMAFHALPFCIVYATNANFTFQRAKIEPAIGIALSCFLMVYTHTLTSNPHPKKHTPLLLIYSTDYSVALAFSKMP